VVGGFTEFLSILGKVMTSEGSLVDNLIIEIVVVAM
jgi:hypothetical protein